MRVAGSRAASMQPSATIYFAAHKYGKLHGVARQGGGLASEQWPGGCATRAAGPRDCRAPFGEPALLLF